MLVLSKVVELAEQILCIITTVLFLLLEDVCVCGFTVLYADMMSIAGTFGVERLTYYVERVLLP